MNVRFWMALAVTYGAFSLDAAIVPGEPAPDLVVRDVSGNSVRLSAYRQKKHVALLTVPPGRAAGVDWPDTNRRLAALDTAVLFLVTDTEESREFLDNVSIATLLLDRAGVVRRVLTGRVLTGVDLAHFVELWQSGKTYFVAYCSRCHGEDGDSTLCVEKPLTGVGQKLSPEQIRDRLRVGEMSDTEVLIRGEIIKRSQLDAIIVYVAGL
jgi:hypothetical protein